MAYNKFLDKDRFSDTGTAEQANLATSGIGSKQVDDFDTSLEYFRGGGLINEFGGFSMDGRVLGSLDGTSFIDGFADDVHDATECAGLYESGIHPGKSVLGCIRLRES
jgi:hypothetical protein